MMHPQKSAQSILPDLEFLAAFPASSCIKPLPLLPALADLLVLVVVRRLLVADDAELLLLDPALPLLLFDDSGSFPSLLFEMPSTSSTERAVSVVVLLPLLSELLVCEVAEAAPFSADAVSNATKNSSSHSSKQSQASTSSRDSPVPPPGLFWPLLLLAPIPLSVIFLPPPLLPPCPRLVS